MMQVAMQMRILKGEINNFDLMGGIGQYIQWVRLERETGAQGGASMSDGHDKVLKILELHRPKLISAAKSVDEKKKIIDALGIKMKTDKNIASQVVEDMGPEKGVEYLEELQDKHFRSEQK